MKPWVQLAHARIPQGEGELRLMRRDGEFSIMIGPAELMNSRVRGSEEALAAEVCRRLEGRTAPRLLVGGLGMGFTLRAALAALPGDARVEVAELVAEVADWAIGPLEPLHGSSLADPRVRVTIADVADLIAAADGAYDAILLDVDNGPEGLVRPKNDRLYALPGLLSACEDRPVFTQRLKQAGYQVETLSVRSGPRGRGARHRLWLARRS
jgi:spermidine synthase